jgi:ring-1,2-phenylacetyl-CoA epoxidase subunit PaaD
VVSAVAGRAGRALEGVLDPEVPVLSVVDLGIVRAIDEAADGSLDVTLTPTYSGCPAVEAIESAVAQALAPIAPARVRRQYAPAWTTDWISKSGRRKLHEAGYAPPGAATIHIHARQVACPRCASTRTERLAAFSGTACKSLHRCLDCREPFEHVKPI